MNKVVCIKYIAVLFKIAVCCVVQVCLLGGLFRWLHHETSTGRVTSNMFLLVF